MAERSGKNMLKMAMVQLLRKEMRRNKRIETTREIDLFEDSPSRRMHGNQQGERTLVNTMFKPSSHHQTLTKPCFSCGPITPLRIRPEVGVASALPHSSCTNA